MLQTASLSWQQSPEHFNDNDHYYSSSSPSPSSSSSNSSSSSSPPLQPPYSFPTNSDTTLPFSLLTSSLELLDDPSFTEDLPALLEDALAEEECLPEEKNEQIILYAPPFSFSSTTATSTSSPFSSSSPPYPVVSGGAGGLSGSSEEEASQFLLPASVVAGDVAAFCGERLGRGDEDSAGRGAGGAAAVCPAASFFCQGAPRDLDERARRRHIKAELRKQRNKEAARRSNLNKKLFRDQLQKKSVELCEENLQLRQDIQDLGDQLRHIIQIHSAIKHNCRRRHLR